MDTPAAACYHPRSTMKQPTVPSLLSLSIVPPAAYLPPLATSWSSASVLSNAPASQGRTEGERELRGPVDWRWEVRVKSSRAVSPRKAAAPHVLFPGVFSGQLGRRPIPAHHQLLPLRGVGEGDGAARRPAAPPRTPCRAWRG
ncbi:uncharacterized protein LOC126981165 [Eriocheir sinensis]|uniref:uncharacterized protein LOC126981165 n=1 Tax=Eriocheir sinensis TaxID=95602 RepID=UPI0021C57E09|nr:uncharacterized protein LOC126981165 [Eriocheir sinensis]